MSVRAFPSGFAVTIGMFVSTLSPGIPRAVAQDPAISEAIRQPGRVTSFEHVNQQLTIKCDTGMLLIKAYADNVVQVRYLPGPARGASPVPGHRFIPAAPKYRVESTLPAIRMATSRMMVSVDRRTAQITFLDAKQNVLLTTRRYYLKADRTAGEAGFSIHAEFAAPEEEAYYDLGPQPGSGLDRRGQTVRLWHDSVVGTGEEIALPFLVTNRNYGFLLDNSSRTTVIPGKDSLTTWDAEAGDALSYFVIYGETTDAIYAAHQSLIGATPPPPKK